MKASKVLIQRLNFIAAGDPPNSNLNLIRLEKLSFMEEKQLPHPYVLGRTMMII